MSCTCAARGCDEAHFPEPFGTTGEDTCYAPPGPRLRLGRRPGPSRESTSRQNVRRTSARCVARFSAGDHDAVTELYHAATRGPLYTVAMSVLRDPERARDCVQESFVKAWQAAATIDPTRPISPWLYAIARRTAIDILRRESRVRPTGDQDDVDSPVLCRCRSRARGRRGRCAAPWTSFRRTSRKCCGWRTSRAAPTATSRTDLACPARHGQVTLTSRSSSSRGAPRAHGGLNQRENVGAVNHCSVHHVRSETGARRTTRRGAPMRMPYEPDPRHQHSDPVELTISSSATRRGRFLRPTFSTTC